MFIKIKIKINININIYNNSKKDYAEHEGDFFPLNYSLMNINLIKIKLIKYNIQYA
jgi:hypothetical protein